MKNVVNPTYWRMLLSGWSVIIFVSIIWDFLTNNGLNGIIAPIAAIYTAMLALYSVEKEFERWYETLTGKHFGEIYVVIWSVLLIAIFSLDAYFRLSYNVPSEIVATYIAVVGILAVTKRSKKIFSSKRGR